MLKINIEDLTFNCIIGILPNEREEEQKVVINISFEYFYKGDGSSFIDYSEVATLTQDIMIDKQFRLIEDAIIFIRKELKLKLKIKNLKLKISKPDILSNCVVSVEE
ncbi:MAG: dihydroneopterin aldolase [Arcobacteraceae bacterium]|nr:dihydroneopterin aldolase [Arcobacteraceae bacterium]